jgi:hypothetical protein
MQSDTLSSDQSMNKLCMKYHMYPQNAPTHSGFISQAELSRQYLYDEKRATMRQMGVEGQCLLNDKDEACGGRGAVSAL